MLLVFDNDGRSLAQKEIPVYSLEKIAIFNKQNNSYQYELNDHLGNVRAVIGQSKTAQGQAEVIQYSDYYPFGSDMTLSNSDYRYGYQGQYAEKDKETGWNSFELRMYDPVIGRWMSEDPYRQYASPYVGMGNNPHMLIDMSGGWTGDPPSTDPGQATAYELVINDNEWWFSDGKEWKASLNEVEIFYQNPNSGGQDFGWSSNLWDTGPESENGGGSDREDDPTYNYVNAGPGANSGGWLNSPVGNSPISSIFKSRRTCVGCSLTHGGTDYSVPIGTPVVATAPGTVARAYKSSTYGNVVVVNHRASPRGGGNVYTLYGHGKSLQVQQGQSVGMGDLLIYSGNTGNSTGPHLHYEVIVTPFTPFQSGFFGNLNIRYGPGELGYFLGH